MNELLIADDHPLFREALRGLISKHYPNTKIYEAENSDSLFALVDDHADADLLLLDLNMPGAEGYSSLVFLRSHHPQLPIAIISAHEDPTLMRRAVDHGAMGYIPKSADIDTLCSAIDQILSGEIWLPQNARKTPAVTLKEKEAAKLVSELTPQQFRVLQMVTRGRLNKQIAYDLGVSETTIKTHMTAILRKLGVSNRTQAVLLAYELDLQSKGESDLQEFLGD
ncbi:MAG: response regulator transcription factor [Alcaligenaceae bacterium]|nr:response regulator transcription factor [Alcaligenaceae bacterium]